MSEATVIETHQATAVSQLVSPGELELLFLTVQSDQTDYLTMQQLIEPDSIQQLLALQTQYESSMDIRTQAAYLTNGLGWQWLAIICWMDLRGLSLDDILSGKLSIRHTLEQGVYQGEPYVNIRYHFRLPEVFPAASARSAQPLGCDIVELMTPLLQSIKAQSGLSMGALWRLITDSITHCYLYIGGMLGQQNAAMARARDIVNATGKPLANPQWQYQHIAVPAEVSPNGKPLAQWYRTRGGCCRYYTLPEGEYCSTCVHLSDVDQQQRLEDVLRNQC